MTIIDPKAAAIASQLFQEKKEPLFAPERVLPKSSGVREVQAAMLATKEYSVEQIQAVTSLSTEKRKEIYRKLERQQEPPEHSEQRTVTDAICGELNRQAARQGKPAPYVRQPAQRVGPSLNQLKQRIHGG